MPENKIGEIPKFDTDETPSGQQGTEEVKEAPTEDAGEEEKETPAELPAEEKPAEEAEEAEEAEAVPGEDIGALHKAIDGLTNEKAKLLEEIKILRGTKREIKREDLS